jgi:hypothetical protein
MQSQQQQQQQQQQQFRLFNYHDKKYGSLIISESDS